MVKHLQIHGLLILVCWLYLSVQLKAQYYYTVEHFDIDNGLPSNTVYRILQDDVGCLWIGTGSGLCKYDGIQFKTYGNHQIFAEDMPWIYQYNNRLWTHTWSGKIGYIANDSLFPQTFNRLNADSVPRYFLADKSGGYWIRIKNNQVMHYDRNGHMEMIPCKNHHLFEDKNGNIYGYGSGFSYYHSSENRFITLKEGLTRQDYFYDYYIDDHVLWSQNNLYCYVYKEHQLDEIKFKIRLPINDDYVKNPIRQVIKDQNGNYWIHDGTQIHLYDSVGILKDDITAHLKNRELSITMLFVDRENNLWICTQNNGLFFIRDRNILNYSMAKDNYISQLCGGTDGSLLMAHQSGKLSLIDAAGRLHFFSIPNCDGGVFYGLHFYNGSFYGIINRNFFEISTDPVNLKVIPLNWAAKNIGLDNADCFGSGYIVAGHWVYSVLRDNKKNSWLGTNKGLYMIPSLEQQWPFASKEHFISYRIKKNKKGEWIPDQKSDTVDIYKIAIHANRENNAYINQIVQDNDGVVWIATQCEGVWSYQNGKIKIYNKTNGLCSNNINNVYVDEKDRIWVSTNAGVSCIQPDGRISNITTNEGILSNQVNGLYLYNDSILYVGTAKGLSLIDISQPANYLPETPVFTKVKIGDEIYREFDDLRGSYWQREILIEYLAVSFKGKLKYKYMIEGLTDKWQITESQSIHIPQLPPGKYKIKIKAVNQNGIESKETAFLTFSIAIPFWQTTTSWIIVIFITFTILFFISFYIHRRKIKSLELKKKIDELERKALLSQINPHFVFNSLSAIKYLVANRDVEKADEYLQKFAILMRTTLDFSDSKWISLEEELDYINNYLSLEKLRFNQFFNYKINLQDNIKHSFIQLPPMLLQPFIENAIRHGLRPKKDAEGRLIISVSYDEHGIKIIIDDNGIGINASLKLNTGVNANYQSKGMHLSIQRARLQGIEVSVVDKQDINERSEGTLVILKLKNGI